MGKAFRLLAVSMMALFVSACGQGDHETLVITGSSTLAPLIGDLAADYEASNPGVRVDVQSGGSSRGINDVRRGTAAVGMVSRELREEESDLTAYVVARDGISLLVHESNPLDALSADQVRRIYYGEIRNWDDVTDFQEPVTVVHKGEGRATLAVFLAHFDLDNGKVQPDLVVGENQQAIRSVAGNPGAIGYVSIGAANHEAERGAPVKGVAIEGVSPDKDAVASGDYPLTRNLNLVSNGPLQGLAKDFVDYVRSPQAHERIRDHFFTPVAGTR
ncbi:MAG: phosphate ABC transporter substrate-binding protein [Oleiphilaceae bacterium]|nr:phosphate ABC transporter substrate-binding protein [Oleiphilaceae bacterium]